MQIHAHTDKILECIINVNLRRGHSVKKKKYMSIIRKHSQTFTLGGESQQNPYP